MTHHFALHCLGGPALFTATGEQVRFRTRKHFALLIRLALDAGKQFTRDYLADLLWPDVPPKFANHSLAQGLSVIKAKIAQALANHMTLFHQHYPHMAVYLHDYHHLMQKLQKDIIETPKHYQRLWAALLQQGIDAGELRNDLDVKVTVYAILGMCNWVYRWYNPEGKQSAEAIAAIFTTLILDGLSR